MACLLHCHSFPLIRAADLSLPTLGLDISLVHYLSAGHTRTEHFVIPNLCHGFILQYGYIFLTKPCGR